MLPLRFRNIRPYLASFLHAEFKRPPVGEMLRWIFQPGKEKRASKFIREKSEEGEFIRLLFAGIDRPFYYPRALNWVDLCQTVDEIFAPANWHQFVTEDTPITADDIVVDCGAAEGLFTLLAAETAKKVYAVEPIPDWKPALDKTFGDRAHVEVLGVGVAHRVAVMKMSENGMSSAINAGGTLEVPIETVDHLFFDKGLPVTFLKADVEGYEFPMILGAENTIRENRPKIAITVYHDTNHFVEIREFLRSIHGDYRFKTRGIAANGNPVLLLAF